MLAEPASQDGHRVMGQPPGTLRRSVRRPTSQPALWVAQRFERTAPLARTGYVARRIEPAPRTD